MTTHTDDPQDHDKPKRKRAPHRRGWLMLLAGVVLGFLLGIVSARVSLTPAIAPRPMPTPTPMALPVTAESQTTWNNSGGALNVVGNQASQVEWVGNTLHWRTLRVDQPEIEIVDSGILTSTDRILWAEASADGQWVLMMVDKITHADTNLLKPDGTIVMNFSNAPEADMTADGSSFAILRLPEDQVQRYDTATLTRTYQLDVQRPVWRIALDDTGQRIGLGSQDSFVVHNVPRPNSQPEAGWYAFQNYVIDMALLPNGDVANLTNNQVVINDLRGGTRLYDLPRDEGSPQSLIVSEDGTYMAVVTSSSVIRFQLATSDPLRPDIGRNPIIYRGLSSHRPLAAAFISANNLILITYEGGYGDGWILDSGTQRGELPPW